MIAKSVDIVVFLLCSFTQISVIFEFVVIAYRYNLACLVALLYDLVRFVVKCDQLLRVNLRHTADLFDV